MAKSMKLPKTLFAKVETDDRGIDEPWLSASADIEGAVGDDTGAVKVGVYELVETRVVQRQLRVLTTGKKG